MSTPRSFPPSSPSRTRGAVLLALLIGLLATTLPSRAALVGYWNFDEGSGTVANDTSGRVGPLNGTLSGSGGGPVPGWVNGRFGKAVDFNFGSLTAGGLVTVPYNADLRLTSGAFTISLWWRPDYTPAASTFPGIIRIGSQSAVPPAANAGWGFFRTQPNTARFKRGNHQPDVWRPAMTVGQWHHVAITHDGAGNNVAYVNGTTATFVTNWPALTTTAVLEMGRMDSFDDAGLDDVALFNEFISLGKMRSLYTVPTSLAIEYDLAKMRQVWAIFDAGAGSSGSVDGITWSHTTTLPGSTTQGDAYVSGTKWYVVLGPGAGVSADVQLRGPVSPAGIGQIGTTTFDTTPVIGATANLVFDLGSTTTVGGGANDLYVVNGDLNLLNNTVTINPTAPLAAGTYRLINYTGTKSGSLNPVVSHQSRYTFTIDESAPGEINLVVSGANAPLKWNSTGDANWNLTSANWLNLDTAAPSAFFQGDTARFDDSGAFPAAIALNTTVFPSAVTVDSSTLNYAITGSGRISGLANGLTKSGASTLTLGTANDFLGTVTASGGTLRLANGSALGSTNAGTTVSGATLDLAGVSPGLEPFQLGGSGLNSTGAVINSGAALVNDGLRGAVTLASDLTVGGPNRFDFINGSLNGAGFKLTKIGPAEIGLSGLGETGLGEIDIQQGSLTILGSTLPGAPSKSITVRSNAALNFWATAPRVINKPIMMEWATMRNNTSPNTDITTNAGAVKLSGSNVFNIAATIRLQGEVGGDGAIIKNGAGTLALDTDNIYSGDTIVQAGRLTLGSEGGVGGSPHLVLFAGTVLDASPISELRLRTTQNIYGSGAIHGNLTAGSSSSVNPGLPIGTLTVTNRFALDEGSLVNLDLGSVTNEGGAFNDLISVGGNLEIAGPSTIIINPTGPLGSDPYTLISYAGSLNGNTSSINVTSDTRMTFDLDTGTPGKLRVKVSGGQAELAEWTGGDAGAPKAWDTKTTANWTTTVVPDLFYAGDTTVFNDLGTVFDVELIGDLYPANTRVEADANDYGFLGNGRIRGGSLLKSLGGKLTIANSGVNDYPGPTVINGGAIQVGVGGTAGNLGPGAITNNGRLILNRSDALNFANTMVGSGVLEKQGANLLTLPSTLAGFDGGIVINGGITRPTATNGVGTATGGTTIANGGTLDLNGLNIGLEPITASGAGVDGNGAIVNLAGGQNNALRYVTLTGDTTVGGSGRWDIRNLNGGASLTGNGFALTKTGANQVSLVGLGDTGLGNIDVRQGLLSVEGNTGLGPASGAVSVQPNATLMFWGSTVPHEKQFALNGGARIFKDNGTATLNGTMSLTGSNALEAASNSGTDLTVGATISGGGQLNKLGAGNVILLGNNTYSGGTRAVAGNLLLGNGGTSGSVEGDIEVQGGLFYHRSDELTLRNNLTGAGNVFLRTAAGLILDGTAQVNLSGSTGNGSIEVGRDVFGRLIIRDGANPVVGRISVGNVANTPGEVIQEGGNVTISLEARIGHWPNNTSTYVLGGGTLSLTNVPTGAAAERNGILYIGVDGTGVFTQTGGVATAHGIVLDNRGNTAGDDTLNLDGGVFNIGGSGLTAGGNGTNSVQVNLGGGRISALTNWSSPLNMKLTANSGDFTFDTRSYSNHLAGALSSFGGLTKLGSGILALAGTNTYEGATLVREGTLLVLGELGVGFGEISVAAGATLSGTGKVHDMVFIKENGILAPGRTPGAIGTLSTLNSVELGGDLTMDIAKAGTTLSSDRLSGSAQLTLGGRLLVSASGDALAGGDSFRLFDATTIVGAFASVSLPTLPAGLSWDTSKLATEGVISVTAPPPTLLNPVVSNNSIRLTATGGVPGAPYRVVASIDVAAPIGTWTEVANGTFDASGNLDVVIAIDPAEPKKFYSIRTP